MAREISLSEKGDTGDAGARGRQGVPGPAGHVPWVGALLPYLAILLIGALGWHSATQESHTRADQVCTALEYLHKQDVEQLKGTYKYLETLPAERFKSDPLTKRIVIMLPVTRAKAETDTAPDFCDDPGYGLPEPDPTVPCQPKSIPIPPPDRPCVARPRGARGQR